MSDFRAIMVDSISILNPDTLQLILLRTQPEDLNQACQTNRQFNRECQNPIFQKMYRQKWYLDIRDRYTNQIIDPTQGFIEAVKVYQERPSEEALNLIDFFVRMGADVEHLETTIKAVINTGSHSLIDRFLPIYQSKDFYGVISAALEYYRSDPSIFERVKYRYSQLEGSVDTNFDQMFLDLIITYAIEKADLLLFNYYFPILLDQDGDLGEALYGDIQLAVEGFDYEYQQNKAAIDLGRRRAPWLDRESNSSQIFEVIVSYQAEIPWSVIFIKALHSDNLDLIKWVWSKMTPESRQPLINDGLPYYLETRVADNLLKGLPINDEVTDWILSLGVNSDSIIRGRILGGDSSALQEDSLLVSQTLHDMVVNSRWIRLTQFKDSLSVYNIIDLLNSNDFRSLLFMLIDYGLQYLFISRYMLDRAKREDVLTVSVLQSIVVATIENSHLYGNLSNKVWQFVSNYVPRSLVISTLISKLRSPTITHRTGGNYKPEQLKYIIDWLSTLNLGESEILEVIQIFVHRQDLAMIRYSANKLITAIP